MTWSYLKNKAVISSIVVIAAGCSGKGGGTSATNEGGSTDPVVTLSISGSVSSSAAVVSGQSFFSKLKKLSLFTANPCAGAPWSMSYVGGGGEEVATGTADANGNFNIPEVPQGKEGVVHFTGASCTQSCLVKAGDEGIICNPVADAVVGAFENALAKTVTDTDFNGVQLAKIGSAIQQAAEGDSAAVTAFNEDIKTCATSASAQKPECYKNAIEASPFSGQFKMLQAAASGWTVESIYTFLADSAGFKINVDSFIYTPFGTQLDTWLQTDFVAASKAFISALVADQEAGGTTAYAVKISCRGSYAKYHAGGQFNFDPVLVDGVPSCKNLTALQANGLTEEQANSVFTAIDDNWHNAIKLGSVDCTAPNAWEQSGFFCMWPPEMQIESKFKEVNRNDPEGKQGSFEENRSISMVNIFSELNQALQNLPTTNPPPNPSCMSGGGGGPPQIDPSPTCQNWFGSIMLANKKNFAGVMGLYMYLDNPAAYQSAGSSKLSLNDIHKIFTGSSFLNAKAVAWAPMYNGISVEFDRNQRHLQPILAYDSATDRFKLQDIFKFDFGSQPTAEQANAAIALSSLPFKYTFQMFEHIPDSNEIRNFIFGSAHHEEWNPSGSKYFYVAGKQNTGLPVLCKMVNKDTGKAMEAELSSKSTIQCLSDYSGMTNTDGALAGAAANYPYALVNRGWMGDQEGSLYVLADRKTGMPVRPGNSEIFVKEYRDSNAHDCNVADEKGTIVKAKMKYGWGEDTREEALKAYCLDMGAYTNSGLYRFYDGGELEIKHRSEDGQVYTFRMRQVGMRANTGGDQTTLLPVCAFTSSIAKNDLNLSSLTGGTLVGSSITDVGTSDMVFDECSSQAHSALTKYNLIMMGGSEGTNRADLKAYLMSSTGTAEFVQAVSWADATNFEETLMNVSPTVIELSLSNKLVAPEAAPVFTSNVKLLNAKYNAKFDPYCDDINGNGYCDCFEASTYDAASGTGPLKTEPQHCSLLDFAAEPTMSNAPYCVQCDNSSQIAALFAAMGGKAGADLANVPALSGSFGSIPERIFNGDYISHNSMWFNIEESFQCQFKATGESFYRKPSFVRWEDFTKNHEGCPAGADGAIVAITNWGAPEEAGGGPIRMVQPRPMNNAYDVAKPDTMMKLINYATKSIGQNVDILSSDKVFNFDEALALVSLRNSIPLGITVYHSDGVTPAMGAHSMIQEVETANQHSDAASAVLRGLTRPSELTP